MDPLTALRSFTMRGELDRIVRTGEEFRFGSEYSFPRSSPTAFRSKQGSLYTLDSLVFFLRCSTLRHSDYMQHAAAERVVAITLPDRKPLLDYLHGRISSCPSIELVPLNISSSIEEYRPDDPALSIPPPPDLPTTAAAAAAAAYEDMDYVGMILALERPLKTRETLLDCRNHDFYAVLQSSLKRVEERQRLESQKRKDGLVAKTRLSSVDLDDVHSTPRHRIMQMKGGKLGEGVPIILVPSAFQTLITIFNVKEFLEDGVFVPSESKQKQMKGPKPELVTVQKKLSRDRAVAAYEVRDKPSTFKPDDWDRVVAVFVLGKEWQFKDWPFKSHVEIFNKIIGFFVRFEDDSIESAKTVKQWNVKIISISKNKRHQDRAAALEVWDRLEEFMRSRSHT